jgi:hypothetical protein
MRDDVIAVGGWGNVLAVLADVGVSDEHGEAECGPLGSAVPATDVEEGAITLALLGVWRTAALEDVGGATWMRAEAQHGGSCAGGLAGLKLSARQLFGGDHWELSELLVMLHGVRRLGRRWVASAMTSSHDLRHLVPALVESARFATLGW